MAASKEAGKIKRWEEFHVTLPGMDTHANTAARARLERLFDDGVFTELDTYAKSQDGRAEVITAFGTVNGGPVYAFSQDESVAGGAISVAQGTKLSKLYALAAKTGTPLVGMYASNGVRLKEDVEALGALGDMLKWSNNLSGVVPQISVVAGTCIGTSALMAAGADFVILSKDAQFSLTGEGSSEEVLRTGLVSVLAEDETQAVEQARRLLCCLPVNNLAPPPVLEECLPASDPSLLEGEVSLSGLELLEAIADAGSVTEIGKGFGSGTLTAFAALDGTVAGVVSYGKEIGGDCAAKAARLIRFCDAFSLPVISLIDTEKIGVDNSLRYTSLLTSAYAEATTQKIAVVTGKAYGAAFVTLAGKGANADLVFAWEQAEISALTPDAAITILWNERLAEGEKREDLLREYRAEYASALSVAAKGHLEDVFSPAETREKLIAALDLLAGKRVAGLPKKHANFPL